VRQPLADMAGAAVRLVLAQGRGGDSDNASIELATTLVARETSAPPGDIGTGALEHAPGIRND
jgi:DNA-binding LacI/PurR family transcriptional regulator